ncbi:hypothetical protein D3C87_17710 [compost metagenome]
MIWKRVLVLILYVMISDFSEATLISSYEPFARMNAAKTYYFVSVPESPNSDKGYTAVFDAKTKILKFKINMFFKERRAVLTNDGRQIIQVNINMSKSVENCSVTIYTDQEETKTLQVFQKKSKWVEDIYSVSHLSDIWEENNKTVLYTSDSIYKIDQSSFLVTAQKNDLPKTGKSYEQYNKGNLRNDLFFDISELKPGKLPLIRQLEKDLNVKLVNDKEKAARAVFFTLTLNADGTFGFMDVEAAEILDLSKAKWVPDEKLKQMIIQKLKTYTYLKSSVPEGLPYWVFTGKMYLLQ